MDHPEPTKVRWKGTVGTVQGGHVQGGDRGDRWTIPYVLRTRNLLKFLEYGGRKKEKEKKVDYMVHSGCLRMHTQRDGCIGERSAHRSTTRNYVRQYRRFEEMCL